MKEDPEKHLKIYLMDFSHMWMALEKVEMQ